MSKTPAIGIDLGTTYSVVAIYRNGQTEIIQNDQGNRTTPSCVAFTDTERLIGEGAYHNAGSNPENTVSCVKRLIGRTFDDQDIQQDLRSCPFQVVNENNKMKIKVTYKQQVKSYFPEQISAMVLEKMKKTAEIYLGTPVKDIVITCPAYFNNGQRQATKDAANIAGLNVLRMINEPTAAAIAYGLSTKNVGRKNVLIFDFGGGTFDVSILTIKDKDYKVRSTKGDTHLGGEDFDNRMVKHFIEEFKRKFNEDISGNKGLIRNLKTQCECAKRILSNATKAEIHLQGANLSTSILRARFEDLCMDLFQKSIILVQAALKDAEMSKHEIQDVVLVGGSSRIPKIQEMLREFFDGKELNKTINPDEAVAMGAAIQAAMLQDQLSECMKGLKLADVCPLSLGRSVHDGSFACVIKRNTCIPTEKSKYFYTVKDNQTSSSIKIYEGERYLAKDNHFLGKFYLDNIPPAPRGFQTKNIFKIDADGILTVTAMIPQTGHCRNLKIVNNSRLSEEDAKLAAKEAADLRADDEYHQKRLKIWNEFEEQLYQTNRRVQNMSGPKKETLSEKIQDLTKWIEENKMATVEQLNDKRYEFEEFLNKEKSQDMPKSESKTGFVFGTKLTDASCSYTTGKSGFSFGIQSKPAEKSDSDTKSKPTAIAFGSPASSTTAKPDAASKSTFSFGVPQQSKSGGNSSKSDNSTKKKENVISSTATTNTTTTPIFGSGLTGIKPLDRSAFSIKPATSTSEENKGSLIFGTAKKDEEPKAASSGFAFGQSPVKTGETRKTSQSVSSSIFGGTSANKHQAGFSFMAAAQSSSAPTNKNVSKPESTAATFGLFSSPKSTTASGFTFGSPATDNKLDTKQTFGSFGGTTKVNEADKKSSIFGGITSGTAVNVSASSSSPSPFVFGSGSSTSYQPPPPAAYGTQQQQVTPSFSTPSPPTFGSATQSAIAPGFPTSGSSANNIFGGNATPSSPFGQTPNTSVSLPAFGSSGGFGCKNNTPAPLFGSGSGASTASPFRSDSNNQGNEGSNKKLNTGFQFNASGPNTSSSTGSGGTPFLFGGTPNQENNNTKAAFNFSPAVRPTFNFTDNQVNTDFS